MENRINKWKREIRCVYDTSQRFRRLLDMFDDSHVAKFFDNARYVAGTFEKFSKRRWSLSRYSLRLSLTINRPEGSASQEEQNGRSTEKIEENKMKRGRAR